VSFPSALDRPIALAELVDAHALDEVVRTYAAFHGVGVAVLGADGKPLAGAGQPQALCRAAWATAEGRDRCAAQLAEVRALRPAADTRGVGATCFTGLEYHVEPLVHDGALLGSVVVGPFPSATGYDAARLGDHVARVLQTIVHAQMGRHLVSQLHVATLEETTSELADKNRRLAAAVERMQEVDRLKSNFLATVSHELRTPLTSVIGYAEMLLEGLAGPLSREQRDYVQIIMEKGDQLLQLITGILDVSRMETGSLRVAREPVNLRELVESGIAALGPLARRKRLEILGGAPADAPRVQGDREKIRQVLLNLLGNAVKFTPEGGRVEVTIEVGPMTPLEELGAHAVALGSSGPARHLGVRMSIADNGIGIAPESQGRIFEPFFQVDSSSTRAYGGTGLGLTLVKSYVEAHGGRVWVDSELGRGSAFTVTLPAVEEDLRRWLAAGPHRP